jgi:hypothetical protein
MARRLNAMRRGTEKAGASGGSISGAKRVSVALREKRKHLRHPPLRMWQCSALPSAASNGARMQAVPALPSAGRRLPVTVAIGCCGFGREGARRI